MSYVLPKTPRLATIPLPQDTPPLFIRASLSSTASTIPVDFSLPSLIQALAALTPDEASRPATSPATNVVRIVHSSLAAYTPIYIVPRPGSNVVTVMDVLGGLYNHLWTPIANLSAYDTMRRRDIILAAQERCERLGVQNDDVRNIDLLEHATLFNGLVQDVALARTMVAPGHLGIDEYQALTWVLQTEEPRGTGAHPQRSGLGPYNRWQ